MRDIKIDPNKKDLVKKYSITKEEREKFETFQSILSIHNLEMDAIKEALLRHAISIRQRLHIEEKDAPKGYERFIEFDPVTYELLVIDRPVLEEPKKEEDNQISQKN